MFIRWIFWFCVGMALGFVFIFMMAQMAKASHHRDENQHWYDYACCSDHDCYKLETHVRGTAGGWYIEETNELIPYGDKRERHSKDKYFHRCYYKIGPQKGETRCLYVPGFGS